MAKTPGDEEFIAFVAAHADRLVRTAELMCGDRGRAEDLVQSALERTYLRWHKVDHEDPYGCVYRAVVNGNRDWWRRSRGREHSVPARSSELSPTGPTMLPSATLFCPRWPA